MKFALIGGDDRFVRLVRLLRADGHEARPFALERALPECGGVTAEAAVSGAEVIVLPLPAEKGGAVNAPYSAGTYAPAEVLRFAQPGTLVCAGNAGAATRDACRDLGLELADYGRREDFALRNADLTAEGTLSLLLEGSPGALKGAEILIAGYGRIGKILAEKLRALGARVTVAARSPAARAAAELQGCEAVPVAQAAAPGYDAAVNTIPEPVFGVSEIERFGAARLIELASPPYGFDFAAAEALGKKVLLASGLPGKTAPESAAKAVQKTICAIIEERQQYDERTTADRAGPDRLVLHL